MPCSGVIDGQDGRWITPVSFFNVFCSMSRFVQLKPNYSKIAITDQIAISNKRKKKVSHIPRGRSIPEKYKELDPIQ